MMHDMIVFGYDDWHGLYVDGKLVFQGHTVPIFEIVNSAGEQPFTLEQPSVNEDAWASWIEQVGELPVDYNNIPKEVFT